MVKTYQLKDLWSLLPLERANPPLTATLDAFGGGLVKYAVFHDGIWLFASEDLLNVHESEALTGFHPADLIPKKIEGLDGYLYTLQEGAPLLPIPFYKDQLIEFDERLAGLIASMLERGDDTDAWIANVEKINPEAAELARGILYGQWPVDSYVDIPSPGSCNSASTQRVEPEKKTNNALVIPLTKAALIAEHIHEWPTIARDIKGAKNNGLAEAAKAGVRRWWEDRSLIWARANGRLVNVAEPAKSLAQAMHNLGSLPSQIHTLQT